jgi:hypothetical protein
MKLSALILIATSVAAFSTVVMADGEAREAKLKQEVQELTDSVRQFANRSDDKIDDAKERAARRAEIAKLIKKANKIEDKVEAASQKALESLKTDAQQLMNRIKTDDDAQDVKERTARKAKSAAEEAQDNVERAARKAQLENVEARIANFGNESLTVLKKDVARVRTRLMTDDDAEDKAERSARAKKEAAEDAQDKTERAARKVKLQAAEDKVEAWLKGDTKEADAGSED